MVNRKIIYVAGGRCCLFLKGSHYHMQHSDIRPSQKKRLLTHRALFSSYVLIRPQSSWNICLGIFGTCIMAPFFVARTPRLDDVDKPMYNYSKTLALLGSANPAALQSQIKVWPCHLYVIVLRYYSCVRGNVAWLVGPAPPSPTSTPRICRYINIHPGLLLNILTFEG